MGKKMIAVLGIGAGYVLARREMRNNPDGPIAVAVRRITENPTVTQARNTAKLKASEQLRIQGERITDKVAESIKNRLFGIEERARADSSTGAEYVDIEVEEVSE